MNNMTQFEQHKILPHNSSEIFKLVMDIDKYHEFLPWCSQSKVISNSEDKTIAELEIKYSWWTQKYRSKIICTNIKDEHYTIDVTAIDGPFEHLHNKWEIIQNSDTATCNVTFFIEFTIRSMLIRSIVEKLFHKMSKELISAFEQRANTIYR